jgi:hypothetical protein
MSLDIVFMQLLFILAPMVMIYIIDQTLQPVWQGLTMHSLSRIRFSNLGTIFAINWIVDLIQPPRNHFCYKLDSESDSDGF